jgi:hypothetical protein
MVHYFLQFTRCVHGKRVEFECQSGLVFDAARGSCVWQTDTTRKNCVENLTRGTNAIGFVREDFLPPNAILRYFLVVPSQRNGFEYAGLAPAVQPTLLLPAVIA